MIRNYRNNDPPTSALAGRDIEAGGLVCNGPPRACGISGRQAMTWHPGGNDEHKSPNAGEQKCH